MNMVSAIKLIFNDYVCSASRLPSEDVCSKRSDSNFREFNLKFQTNSITQALNIVRLRQLWREVACFMWPHCLRIYGSELS